MKKMEIWVKAGYMLLIIYFLIIITDRVLVYFELQSILYYIGCVFGFFKGLFAKIFNL